MRCRFQEIERHMKNELAFIREPMHFGSVHDGERKHSPHFCQNDAKNDGRLLVPKFTNPIRIIKRLRRRSLSLVAMNV